MNIAVTYLEAHLPKPRNSVSIINGKGEVVLNYSKVFICDFGHAELLKPSPNIQEIGCDRNCSPGESFNICALTGAEVELSVGAMICADREFPEPATQLMLNGAELIVFRTPVRATKYEAPDSRRGHSTIWLAWIWRIILDPTPAIPEPALALLGRMAGPRIPSSPGPGRKNKYWSCILT